MGNTNTKDVPQNITTHIVPFYDALLADPDVVIQVLAEHMSQDNKTHVIACCLNMPTIEKQQKLQNQMRQLMQTFEREKKDIDKKFKAEKDIIVGKCKLRSFNF